jgi:putative component of toxin-antitoxin plasmid stabilization module
MADTINTQLENQLEYNKVVPELYYKLAPTSREVLMRRTSTIAPSSGGSPLQAGDNQIVRFKINEGFIDCNSVMVSCDYSQTLKNFDATNFINPPNGVPCCIKELRILSGTGTRIETINEAGLLLSVLQRYSLSESNFTTTHTISGGGENTPKVSDATSLTASSKQMGNSSNFNGANPTTIRYAFHLPSGFLNSVSKYIDTGGMKGLIIEMEFYNRNITFLGKGTGATSDAQNYTLSNFELNYDKVSLSGEYLRTYRMALVQGIEVSYSTYTHQSSTGGDSVRVSKAVSRLKDIISVIRTTSNINNINKNSLGNYKPITESCRWNYQIGSENYPVSQVKGVAETYYQALRTFARNKDAYCGSFNLKEFSDGLGVISYDLEEIKAGVFSGVKTTGTPDILLLSTDLCDSNDTVDTFLHHERILVLTNGSVQVLE